MADVRDLLNQFGQIDWRIVVIRTTEIVGAIFGMIFAGTVLPRRGASAREVAEWEVSGWFNVIAIVVGAFAFVLLFLEPGWLR